VWRWLRLGRLRRAPQLDPVLIHLYALSLQHAEDPDHGHSLAVLRTMSPRDADIAGALAGLETRGLAQQTAGGLWAPTEFGRREASRALEREAGRGMSAALEILLVAVVTAVAAALPGTFLVLRRLAMVSDAISHAILPGIVMAFLLTGDLGSPLLVAGAAATGVLTWR